MIYVIKLLLYFIISRVQLIRCESSSSAIKYITQDEVLNITERYKLSFYCKNNICATTSSYYGDSTVKLPNEYEKITEYIVETCNYDQIISNTCKSKTYCSYNSECLSNKCFVNNNNNNTNTGYCMFNSQTPIVHCDSIYKEASLFSDPESYMHCGKAYGDKCNTNTECSSERCRDGVCTMGLNNVPPDGVTPAVALRLVLMVGIPVCFFICFCCSCFCIKPKSSKL